MADHHDTGAAYADASLLSYYLDAKRLLDALDEHLSTVAGTGPDALRAAALTLATNAHQRLASTLVKLRGEFDRSAPAPSPPLTQNAFPAESHGLIALTETSPIADTAAPSVTGVDARTIGGDVTITGDAADDHHGPLIVGARVNDQRRALRGGVVAAVRAGVTLWVDVHWPDGSRDSYSGRFIADLVMEEHA